MKTVIINGRVLGLSLNGIPRYAMEIIKHLDKMFNLDFKVELVLPENVGIDINLKNISKVYLPNKVLWDYTEAERYAKRKDALYINLASKGTLYKNSITTIHDIRILMFDKAHKSWKEVINKFKFAISYYLALKNSKIVVTDSLFSKEEILKYSKLKKNKKIEIVGMGWEHFKTISHDNSVFDEYPGLKDNNYYLSISSIAPHKNFKWIVENAMNNLSTTYVIVGGTNPNIWIDETNNFGNNIVYLGFQSDERVKALLLKAKALLFPSQYEGFGIPPLESISCGIPAVVSDIPVMHEIYKDKVSYIDPNDATTNLDELISKRRINKYDDVLRKYSWQRAAQKWVDIIRNVIYE